MRPGSTQDELDTSAVLIRAYGKGTELIIDRNREITSHHLLALHGLAPELLASFNNGMLYRFVAGRPCEALDMHVPRVYRGLAQRLGEWHAVISVSTQAKNAASTASANGAQNGQSNGHDNSITPGKAKTNVFTVLNKWIEVLPASTPEEKERNAILRKEFDEVVKEYAFRDGLGENGYVVGHCDLLCANIIIKNQPPKRSPIDADAEVLEIELIDYEYATPCPAAFDLACHFSEWMGFDCTIEWTPGKAARRTFLAEYLHSYKKHARRTSFNHLKDEEFKVPLFRADSGEKVEAVNGTNGDSNGYKDRAEEELDRLCAEVDHFRGVPGLFWGVWSLIQASISDIDFDYTWYAERRLQDYWDWKHEVTGARKAEGREMPVRERRWNSETD